MKKTAALFLTVISFFSCISEEPEPIDAGMLNMPTVFLSPSSKLDKDINESSGIAKSIKYEDIYWLHNDSGDKSVIYPYSAKGEKLKNSIKIPGIKNRDWEDLTIDDTGNLIIGDFGNNNNREGPFSLHILPEPDPYKGIIKGSVKTYLYSYPDYLDTPETKNFDCEAVFWFKGKIYLLTKHWSDPRTTLYRFDSLSTDHILKPEKITDFRIFGMVTGAAASDDMSKLAVITYTSIWVFSDFENDDFFGGSISYLPVIAGQIEAVCFEDADTLIITNEQRHIFHVDLSLLKQIRYVQ